MPYNTYKRGNEYKVSLYIQQAGARREQSLKHADEHLPKLAVLGWRLFIRVT